MRTLLRQHWPGIVTGVLVGLCVSLPNIIFTHSPFYRGVPIMQTDAETMYLSRIHAAYHGCIMSCNPYIKEYGSEYPSFDPSISEAILALPGIIFHLSVIQLKFIYDFLLPFILALLAYTLIWRLTRHRTLSFIGTLFIFLGYNILNPTDLVSWQDLWSLIRHLNLPVGPYYYGDFLFYARPVNPQFSSIVFFGFLHALLSFIRNQNKKTFAALTGIFIFSFYVYFYLFSFLTAVLCVLLLSYIVRRNWSATKWTFASLLCGIIGGLPIIKELIDLIHHPLYKDIPIVSQLTHSHMPVLSSNGLLFVSTMLLLVLLYYTRERTFNDESTFLLILGIACVAILNQQIVTGITLQNFHYEWYYFTPIYITFLAWLYAYAKLPLSSLCICLLTLIVISNALVIDYYSYISSEGQVLKEQSYAPALEWFNIHTARGSIVYAYDGSFSRYIPVYTKNYVFWAYFAMGFITLPERRQDIAHATDPTYVKQFITKYHLDYVVIPTSEEKNFQSMLPKTPLYNDGYDLIYSTHENS